MSRQATDSAAATTTTTTTAMPPDGSIDAGLLLLNAVRAPGAVLTQQEIADACGCSRGYIYLLEKQALEKIRQHLEKRGLHPTAAD